MNDCILWCRFLIRSFLRLALSSRRIPTPALSNQPVRTSPDPISPHLLAWPFTPAFSVLYFSFPFPKGSRWGVPNLYIDFENINNIPCYYISISNVGFKNVFVLYKPMSLVVPCPCRHVKFKKFACRRVKFKNRPCR